MIVAPWKFVILKTNTAISKNVVKRKAKSHKPRLQGNMGNFETMPAPYSKDLRWRVIWMKEVLGYEVDEVAASLCLQELCSVIADNF